MKKYIFITAVVAVLSAGAALSTQAFMKKKESRKTDEEGHVLTALWKAYNDAVDADRPEKMVSALDAIKREARARRLHWDFYDAATKYVDAASARDWKQHETLEEKLGEEVEDYAEPIVTYAFSRNRGVGSDLRDFVLTHRARLQAGRNAAFYGNGSVSNHLNGLLPDYIRDDYEFVLWEEDLQDLLADCLQDTYPNAPYLAYRQVCDKSYGGGYEASRKARRDALEEFAGKYAGKAISLLAKETLLTNRMNDLQWNGGTSEQFKELLGGCEAFEKERKGYSGNPEGKIAETCTGVRELIDLLNSKAVDVSCTEDSIFVKLRNLDQVDVTLRRLDDNKIFLRTTLVNPKNSFFVPDEVKAAIPKVDDGDYQVEAKRGKTEGWSRYTPHTLSIAVREDAGGLKFYVAQFRTGKPVGQVDLTLSRSGKEIVTVKDVPADGFTPLPDAVVKHIKDRVRNVLTASCLDSEGILRRTREHTIWGSGLYGTNDEPDENFCRIFTDRSAYNPGDTVKFKAVLFRGNLRESLRTLDAGSEVNVQLLNAEGRKIAAVVRTTNEYGSVAGEFPLPTGERNGRFRIAVRCGVRELADKALTVDEFQLPTYDLQFEDLDSLYFHGDEITVRGKVTSYSGHPLAAARVTYSVDSWGERIDEGPLTLESDGSFAARFRSDGARSWYQLTVKVADGTGETKEFSRGVLVLDRINLDVSLLNATEGTMDPGVPQEDTWNRILASDTALVRFEAKSTDGKVVPAGIAYSVRDASGKERCSGTVESGAVRKILLKEAGLFTMEVTARMEDRSGQEIASERKLTILKLSDADRVLVPAIENVFKVTGSSGAVRTGEEFAVQFGAGRGEVWAAVELFGDRMQVLDRRMVHLAGRAGAEGSLERIAYTYGKDWPDAVRLKIFYFRNGTSYEYDREVRRVRPTLDLPLSFETFEDRTLPAKEYSFTVKTLPGVEAVAAVFDRSTETIAPNRWEATALSAVRCDGVPVRRTPGGISDIYIRGFGGLYRSVSSSNGIKYRMEKTLTRAPMEMLNDEAMPMAMGTPDSQPEEQAASSREEDAAVEAALSEVAVRSDFSNSLAWEPFLRSSDEGSLTLKFRTSDKLSTYCVQLYAHTPSMRNAVLRKEMVVTIPVKVAVTEPEYLYRGDKYVLHATVSNSSDAPVSGTLGLLVLAPDGSTRQAFAREVTVPASGVRSTGFDVPLPEDGEDALDLKVVFADAAKTFSDGVAVRIPVHEARQILTEAHSAVRLAGMDKDSLIREIASRFTGTTAFGAVTREIDIRQMLLDAIPSRIEPSGKDVLSLSEALYARSLAERLAPAGSDAERKEADSVLVAKILACRNTDGGFGWFEGMKSSPVVTAVLLERFARLRAVASDASAAVPAASPAAQDRIPGEAEKLFDVTASAVRYLDRQQFSHDRIWPSWCGWLSVEQYAYVRSMYASVAFEIPRANQNERSAYANNFKEFRKYIKDYLLPKKKEGRGLNGRILDKSRRIKTLLQLAHNEGGPALASDWGIRLGAVSRMDGSTRADLRSLLEYAVGHRDGGWYYPNAVMPWRGLLESELYAHSLLCNLLCDPRVSGAPGRSSAILDGEEGAAARRIADGIRVWIMLQKETQQWDTDPSYLEAINSVMDGPEALLSTSVIAMSKTYGKPFPEIVAAGNGFTVSRRFFKEVRGAASSSASGSSSPVARDSASGAHEINLLEVRPGDLLHAGDKLIVRYQIWNQENRSFVKLTAPREAGFRPVGQLSGHYGWWLRPLTIRGSWSLTPQGYRNVKADRTEYFFDVYPEEKTTVTEEFFVTQEGTFGAPVVTIESLYAPHYRANDGFSGPFTFHWRGASF